MVTLRLPELMENDRARESVWYLQAATAVWTLRVIELANGFEPAALDVGRWPQLVPIGFVLRGLPHYHSTVHIDTDPIGPGVTFERRFPDRPEPMLRSDGGSSSGLESGEGSVLSIGGRRLAHGEVERIELEDDPVELPVCVLTRHESAETTLRVGPAPRFLAWTIPGLGEEVWVVSGADGLFGCEWELVGQPGLPIELARQAGRAPNDLVVVEA